MAESNTAQQAGNMNDFLLSLSKTPPRKTDLQMRRIRKDAERKRLKKTLKSQKEQMIKLARDMGATESRLNAVSVEIDGLDQQLAKVDPMEIE